ncbi:hypothetical protein OAK10_04460 [Candidatus Pelagibacter sp.]|nr:hypothetical protein [Candidatus Pelagibacter sp.]
MENINQIDNDEIDLIELIKLIFNNKLKLILIILIAAIIGGLYNYNLPNSFQFVLKFKPAKNSVLIDYTKINQFLKTNQTMASNKYAVTNASAFGKFIVEFLDYEELILVLKNDKYIKEQISQLSNRDQKIALGSMARSFTLEPSVSKKKVKNSELYEIKFFWHDKDQGINILDETLNVVLKNLEDRITNDLEKIVKKIYEINIQNNLDRINYLIEQSLIAKELSIIDNQLDSINLSQSNFSFNINSNEAYYLRGYKAIDKEISLIKKREYKNGFLLLKEAKDLKNSNKIKWIDYNINLVEIKNVKKSFLVTVIVSMIIGSIIGVFYIVVFNMLKPKKSSY